MMNNDFRVVCHGAIDDYYVFLPGYLMSNSEETQANRKLAISWATSVIQSLGTFGSPKLILQIAEAHREQPDYEWQAIIASDVNGLQSSGPNQIGVLDASQYYAAWYADSPDDDYMGVLDLGVAMHGVQPSGDGEYNPAKVILQLAAANYYERVAKEYPGWRTDYRDSLRYSEVKLVDEAKVVFG